MRQLQNSSVVDCDVAVIGGGFFGCFTALHLRHSFPRVVIIEKQRDIMTRASHHNQARVHNGYHYPRSLLTAMRSRINFPKFTRDYSACICDTFEKYYAIGRNFSNITAHQFHLFCHRVGIPLSPAPNSVRRLFNFDLIEDVFLVREYAFDADKLREIMRARLQNENIAVYLETQAERVATNTTGKLELRCHSEQGVATIQAQKIFNCSYSQLNQILSASGLPLIPLKHEFTEIALVEIPEPLKNRGITVMCGPFFSTMPFPPKKGLHSLSHVRYTPHHCWHDGEGEYRQAHKYLAKIRKNSKFPYMIRDAQRYLPILRECRYVESMWEVKTVLPKSEIDDSRPILLRKNAGLTNFYCVLGAKIDNVYDLGAIL